MKHKHAELIKAWADGAEIEYYDTIYNVWRDIDINKECWYDTAQYRIKPTPRPQWQQDLIDAAKAGKVVEWYCGGWCESKLNNIKDNYSFGDSTAKNYRIRPEKVTRYLWAYRYGNEWRTSTTFMTAAEAMLSKFEKRLDWSATEFEE